MIIKNGRSKTSQTENLYYVEGVQLRKASVLYTALTGMIISLSSMIIAQKIEGSC